MKSTLLTTLAFAATILAAPLAQQEQVAPHEQGGAEHIVIIDKSSPIPPRVADILERLALNESNPDVHHVFDNSAFKGFAANMKHHCLDLLANMTDVSIVEATTTVQSTLSHRRRQQATYGSRPHSPWGLQRISTTNDLSRGDPKQMDYTYNYANADLGTGADIYIIDTGLYTAHNDFDDRAQMLWSFDSETSDPDGHGTHVAATAGGHLLGVASNANLFGVRALDTEGGGWSSNVVAAINRVIQAHDDRQADPSIATAGSVMSLSLAASAPVAAIDAAIAAAVEAGIHTCVAAGNANEDACSSSPASAGGQNGGAITVGSVGMDDVRSDFSNYGACVDVYAPGEDIISAWPGDPNFINSLSGTSMATPHVTGIVAYAIASNSTLAQSPSLVKEWVRMNGERLGSEKSGGRSTSEVGEMVVASNGVHAIGTAAVGTASHVDTTSADEGPNAPASKLATPENSHHDAFAPNMHASSLLHSSGVLGKLRRAVTSVLTPTPKPKRNEPSAFPASLLDFFASAVKNNNNNNNNDQNNTTANSDDPTSKHSNPRRAYVDNYYQSGETANAMVMEHGFIGKISNGEAKAAAGRKLKSRGLETSRQSGLKWGFRRGGGVVRDRRRWVLSDDGTEVARGGGSYVMDEGFIAKEARD
ncbi:hypothetical protein MBLNU230_g5717t1 [Neophaeotheca triangularis]